MGCHQADQYGHYGSPRGEERERAEKLTEEIMTQSSANLGQDMDIQIQGAQWIPKRINSKRSTLRQIKIKLSKVKDRENLESSKESHLSHIRGNLPVRISVDFSTETLQARRHIVMIYLSAQRKNCQPRILYPAELSFKNEGEIKTTKPDKQKGVHYH